MDSSLFSRSAPSTAAETALFRQPHVLAAQEQIANGTYKTYTIEQMMEFSHAEAFGLYGDTGDVDGHDAASWEARKSALHISSSVVGLRSPTSGLRSLYSSGVVIEMGTTTRVLTSCYILGGRSREEVLDLEVDIFLPNGTTGKGCVSYFDFHHNIALIHGDVNGTAPASLDDSRSPKLGDAVVSVGRRLNHKLIASQGKINVRGDHFDSDDLMSSSCSISEWGIGGPLVDVSSGKVIGMSFFSRKGFTPFMPSSILLQCIRLFLDPGYIDRPWLGMKIRSLNELKMTELDSIYLKFKSTDGVIVKEVIDESPAKDAGICIGDVIISCNGFPVKSPVEIATILLTMVEPCPKKVHAQAQHQQKVSLQTLQRLAAGNTDPIFLGVDRSTPAINQWPVLPVTQFGQKRSFFRS